jgi:hypothetical protein
MSLELLSESGVKGLVPRRYRHELESFAWVLLYSAVCVTNDEENLDVSPFREWVGLTSTDLGLHKSAFISDPANKIRRWVEDPYREVLLSTFRIWRDVSQKQADANFNQKAAQSSSDESLLTSALNVCTRNFDPARDARDSVAT